MYKLPRDLTDSDVVKALSKVGFKEVKSTGKHRKLKIPNYEKKDKNDRPPIVIVPRGRKMALGTLSSIIKQARLTREVFLDLLKDP